MPKRNLENTSRAQNTNGKLITHVSSRHKDMDVQLLHQDGNEFGQGTLFPKFVEAGQITKIESFAQDQWYLYLRKNKPRYKQDRKTIRARCFVKNVFEKEGGFKFQIKLNKYGIKLVECFVNQTNIVMSVYPIETTKGTPLIDKGEKVHKASRKARKRKSGLRQL